MLVWKYRYENCISLTYNFKLVSNIINGGFNDGTVIILCIKANNANYNFKINVYSKTPLFLI